MRKVGDCRFGGIGSAIAAVGIFCATVFAHAQVEPVIQAQIGRMEFRVPKEFVTNWAKSQQHLSVHFSYPEIEPLGRFRFGDENTKKWVDYQQSLIGRGGNILYVTVDLINNPKPLPADSERERILRAICAATGNNKFYSYSEYDVEFFVCRIGDEAGAQWGYHRPSGLSFRRNNHTHDWHVTRMNLDERVRTEVHLRAQDLKDWKAIVARAHAMIDSWKQ